MGGKDDVNSRRYYGHVKSLGNKYGFVACEDTYLEFGRDVHIECANLPEDAEKIGAAVSFCVILNEKGRPQAVDIRQGEEDTDDATQECGEDKTSDGEASAGAGPGGLEMTSVGNRDVGSCYYRTPSSSPRCSTGRSTPVMQPAMMNMQPVQYSSNIAPWDQGHGNGAQAQSLPGDSADGFLSAIDGELRRLLAAPQGTVLGLLMLSPPYLTLLNNACSQLGMQTEVVQHGQGSEVHVRCTSVHGNGMGLTPCPGLRISAACDLSVYSQAGPMGQGQGGGNHLWSSTAAEFTPGMAANVGAESWNYQGQTMNGGAGDGSGYGTAGTDANGGYFVAMQDGWQGNAVGNTNFNTNAAAFVPGGASSGYYGGEADYMPSQSQNFASGLSVNAAEFRPAQLHAPQKSQAQDGTSYDYDSDEEANQARPGLHMQSTRQNGGGANDSWMQSPGSPQHYQAIQEIGGKGSRPPPPGYRGSSAESSWGAAQHGGWGEQGKGSAQAEVNGKWGAASASSQRGKDGKRDQDSWEKDAWGKEGRSQKGGGGCFTCGEVGHRANECPQGSGKGKGGGGCFTCGEIGHRANECPQGGGKGKGWDRPSDWRDRGDWKGAKGGGGRDHGEWNGGKGAGSQDRSEWKGGKGGKDGGGQDHGDWKSGKDSGEQDRREWSNGNDGGQDKSWSSKSDWNKDSSWWQRDGQKDRQGQENWAAEKPASHQQESRASGTDWVPNNRWQDRVSTERPPMRQKKDAPASSSGADYDSDREEAIEEKGQDEDSKHRSRLAKSSKPLADMDGSKDESVGIQRSLIQSDLQRPKVAAPEPTSKEAEEKPAAVIDRTAFQRLAMGHLLGGRRERPKKAETSETIG